jgi:hypothetical protein
MSDAPFRSRGARRRARRRRVVRRVAVLALALMLTGAAVYVGVRNGAPQGDARAAHPSPSSSPTATPMASLDLSGLPIERTEFCGRLDRGDVEDALGGPATDTAHYGSGDRVALTPGVVDVSHEYNCTYDAGDGTQARVWVFAEPVTASVGSGIVREARAESGCRPLRKAPTFGTPAIGTICRTTKPEGRAVTLRGLFGDAWLSCRLSRPGSDDVLGTVRRAEQWCVRVATTLGARP